MTLAFSNLSVYINFDVRQQDNTLKDVVTVDCKASDSDVCKCPHGFTKEITIDKPTLDAIKAIATGGISTAAASVIVGTKK